MTDLNSLIADAAAKYGENPDTLGRIAQIESGGRNVANEEGSGAAGIFQFTPGTWKQYGNGASPYDIAANVDAGARLLHADRLALTGSLGRAPAEDELYLAHQQGAAGATGLITNPDVAAASVVGARAVLANGGSADMTAGQFAGMWRDKFNATTGGGAGAGSSYTPPTVHYTDLMAPPPVDPFAANAEDQRSAYRGDTYDQVYAAYSDAYQTQTIVGNALRNAQMPEFAPDPNFYLGKDQVADYATDPETKQALPPDYISRFYDATSDAQARWIAKRAWEDVAKQKRLATLGGWSQFGLGAAATLTDPGTYALGALTGGLLGPAEQVFARAGRLGIIGFRSLEGGVSNVAITAAMQQQGAPTSSGAYLNAAGMGMALGGVFGALGRNPAVSREAVGLSVAGSSLQEHAAALDPVPAPHGVQWSDWHQFQAKPEKPIAAANDVGPWIKPADLIEQHAQETNPELYDRIFAADRGVAEARAGLDSALNDHAGQVQAAQDTVDGFRGKRRSSPAAQAAQTELERLQGLGDFPDLRLALSDAQQARAALGPELNAQRLKSATWLGESPDGPLMPPFQTRPVADPQMSLTGPAKYPGVISAANDPYMTRAAHPGGSSAPLGFVGHPDVVAERPFKAGTGAANGAVSPSDPQAAAERLAAGLQPSGAAGAENQLERLAADRGAPSPAVKQLAAGLAAERSAARVKPEVLDRASMARQFADASGALDPAAAGDHISARAAQAIAEGRNVILRIGDREMPITGVLRGMLVEENGERISPESVMADATGSTRVEIGAKPAGADATAHPNVPLFLPAGSLESLREAGQYTSNFRTESALKSHVLFPASGTQLASSPFAASRIIGAHFAGNPIGYKNAKNPLDIAMQALLLRDRFNGHLDRFLKPAFNEWAHDQGYSQVSRLTKKPEFMRQVFDYINTKDETTDAHPAVRRYANQAVRPVMRDWSNEINASGLADHIPYDTTYLPRIFDPGKVGDAYRAHGAENLGKLVKASMADMPWTQALTDEQLSKVANGYAEGISKRALDLDQNWSASWSADNLQHLQDVLVSDAKMGPQEAKEITDTVARLTQKDRGANGRLKQRVELNTEATHAATGDLKMSDLLVKDVGYLMERYNDQMAGRVAMARTKITDPASGEVLQNGIKDDAQFETMISNWKRHLEDQYLSRAAPDDRANLERWRDLDEANMRFQYGRILSKVDDGKTWAAQMFGPRTTSGQVMRIMRKYSFDRMMGATGWSHMSIFGANLANFGVRSALEHIPALRHVMSQDGEWIMRHGLDRELEAIFGNHADPLRGVQLQDWEHDWGARPVAQRSVLDKIEHVQAQTNKITAIGSGLAHIIALNKRWAQKGVAQKFADMAARAKPGPDGAFDLSGVNMRRMMQLGLNEGDMQKVLGQVQQHFTTEPGILFNHKVTKLNLDQWDQETSHIFQGALRRWVDRVVQENDVGSLHRWVSSPLWQMMMQFRNFPMVGQTKQLMYNVAMHDKEAFNYFLVQSAIGALLYSAREQVNSIGRSDRQEYLARRLTPGNIAHAALYHSGYAGMMPTMIDTGLRLMGGDPLFDFRTTGNTSALWGAPAVTNVDDFMTAAKALRRPFEESRDRSQAEARALVRLFPWSNTLPGTLATNYLIRNMPERPPREPRGPHGFDALFGTGQ